VREEGGRGGRAGAAGCAGAAGHALDLFRLDPVWWVPAFWGWRRDPLYRGDGE
jgi:hypothetical protein